MIKNFSIFLATVTCFSVMGCAHEPTAVISNENTALGTIEQSSEQPIGQHSREWSYNSWKQGTKFEVSVTKCYDDETMSKISVTWYPTSESYNNSVTVNCECRQNLLLNNKVLVRLDGLDELVAKGMPALFTSHSCVAAD